ncbi:MAG: DNA-processing protein DprA [Burkholderiales bacterium]|jgi:DNA processing protein|nr:DNA-processing protein DprA [Burkholderiales bacterium]
MPHDAGLAAWVRLSLVPGLGGQTLRKLLAEFGLPERVLAAGRVAVARLVGDALAARVFADAAAAAVARALAWAEQRGHRVVTLADEDYPQQLLEIPDPPPLLYVRGDVSLLSARSLAIVGSRNATPQGLANAENFARAFSQSGLAVVSGLALGIDAAAHRGALDGPGSTIGILGTGVDIAYPPRNAPLIAEVAARGAVVSEFPLGTPATAGNFPRRNRLISGLARGVLVVEAATSSGSLITARLAAEQGREVFAIPGSIHSPLAKGCHALIKQGAKLAESAGDVLEELTSGADFVHGAGIAASPSLDPAHARVLDAMGHDPCDLDTLAGRVGLTAGELSSILLALELDGSVSCLPGGRYQRLA